MINKILIFGDDIGIPQLMRHLPRETVLGVVVSSLRPEFPKVRRLLEDMPEIELMMQPDVCAHVYPLFERYIETLNPDLILCHSYSMKIPQEILDIPKYGAINIHFAKLPKYRGANPIEWAIINGETEFGVTMHYMTDTIDSGDIVAQVPVTIEFTDTWIDVRNKCLDATEILIREEMPKILSGTNTRTPQDEYLATTFRRRVADDGEFSWKEPPIRIYNKIRALVKPHPGAFYYDYGGRKVVIDYYVSFASLVSKRKYLWGEE